MKRFSANTLKNSFEVGSTSSWVLAFESVGSKSPNVSNLNIINGEFSPVMDVSYSHYEVKNVTLELGPGINIEVPVFASDHPHSISITTYDSDKKQIREAMKSWTTELLEITKGRAPVLEELKDSCALMNVFHFDKQLNSLSKESFYVLPGGELSFRGDQSFQADTLPITFTVVGTQ